MKNKILKKKLKFDLIFSIFFCTQNKTFLDKELSLKKNKILKIDNFDDFYKQKENHFPFQHFNQIKFVPLEYKYTL